jgi:hypothetical protein
MVEIDPVLVVARNDARPDAQFSGSDARILDIAVFGRRGAASAMI